jgi:general secretion pathway protein D
MIKKTNGIKVIIINEKATNRVISLIFSLIFSMTLTSCASYQTEKFSPSKSYLKGDRVANSTFEAKLEEQVTTEIKERYRFVAPLKLNTRSAKTAEDVLSRFSENATITFNADELPLKDYLHLVLGEQLGLNYILSDEIKSDNQSVTLSLKTALTERKLFTLTEEILTQRDYIIRVDDNVFYVHKADANGSSSDVVYGYGKQLLDIPQTSLEIIQLVPFEYGVQISLANTLRQLLGVRATADLVRNSITVKGKRKDIVRALELIRIMDTPAMKNRQIGMFSVTFISTAELADKLSELLKQEGISVGDAKTTEKTISIVQLNQQGKVVFFANNETIIERAVFWAKEIDKPVETAEKQYFIYYPQYSRAIDMGDSLSALVGGSGNQQLSSSTSAASENKQVNNTRNKKASPGGVNVNTPELKMVVDERTNSLIFYTSGGRYQQLLPLINQLDVLPKQIILEVLIAEVTLTDEFKQGVEFAFDKGGYSLSTIGAIMGEGFGGLTYALQGANGKLDIDLFQTNSLVNVLSRPSVVVRDGVDATMAVGTDIPILGETTSDPNGERQTISTDYRKTGIDLAVTPTVNARGIVLMEINLQISNQIESATAGASGNPSIFERSVKTEVVAESGQTIMLGGLISNTTTNGGTKVPFFSDLPLVGALFRGETKSGDKTELVIFITPKVIESSDEWQEIKNNFNESLTELDINQVKQ